MYYPMTDKTNIDPMELLRYEQYLSEVLKRTTDFDKKHSKYTSSSGSGQGSSTPPERSLLLPDSDTHPLIAHINIVRNRVNEYFRTNRLQVDNPVRNIFLLGRSFKLTSDLPVIDPSGNEVEQDMEGIYGPRLMEEEDFWDTSFELEVAEMSHSNGFDVSLIHEGESPGTDLLVKDNEKEVRIECKRKRDQAEEEKQRDILAQMVCDEIWKKINQDDIGFAIRIMGDQPLTKEVVDPLSEKTAQLISSKKWGLKPAGMNFLSLSSITAKEFRMWVLNQILLIR